MNITRIFSLLFVVCMLANLAHAQVCKAPPLAQNINQTKHQAPEDLSYEELWLDAIAVDGDAEWLIGRGDAYLKYQDYELQGDVLSFNRLNRTAVADNATIAQDGFVTKSEQTHFGGDAGGNEMTAVQYYLQANGGHGKAERAISNADNTKITAYNADYSTCDVDNPTWWVEAKSIDYHPNKKYGVARSATLKIKDVPIFYLPYYRFSLNDSSERQSGFLRSKITYRSNRGLIFLQPYYLNLAPNYDATITAGYIQKYGPVAAGEFRYLTEHSSGQIDHRHLFYKTNRDDGSVTRWRHNYVNKDLMDGKLGTVQASVKYNAASDKEVIDNLLYGFYDSDDNHLLQQYDASWTRKLLGANLKAGVQYRQYDVLDKPNKSPYFYEPKTYAQVRRALPLNFAGSPIIFSGDISHTRLRHPTREEAERLAGNIKLQHHIEKPYGFLDTSAQLRTRQYNNIEGRPGVDSAGYTVPTVAIDAGLRFEKSFENGLRHEISPRLYYAYTPYEEQSDLPRFESTQRSENYNNLFHPDRFNPQDRIGDTHKVTVGLENRLYDEDGDERVEVRAAQSFYLDAPKLGLNGKEMSDKPERSDAFLETYAKVNDRLSLDSGLQFDHEDYDLERTDLGLSYQDDPFAVRLGYINDENDGANGSEFANISGVANVNKRVRVMGRLQYDLENDGFTEKLAGVEYGDCCTMARIGYRSARDKVEEPFDESIMFEVELMGIGQVDTGESFTNQIFGFK